MTKVKVNEILDGEVKFVSLVKRGANRVPFRVKKSEDGMINLDMWTVFKSEDKPAAPYVAAFLVSKGADLELAKALIQKAGFSVEKMEEKEEGFLFVQKAAEGETMLVKASDEIAYQVAGLKKKGLVAYDGETESFKELFSKAGVFPTINVATCVLSDVLYNIAYKADSPSEASNMVSKAIDEFKGFVTGLVGAIPTTAFKMEDTKFKAEVVAELKQKGGDKDTDIDPETGKVVEKSEDVPVTPPVVEAAAVETPAAPVETPVVEAAVETPAAPVVDAAVVEKAEDKTVETEKKKEESVSGVDEIVSKVQKGFDEGFKKVLDTVGERISKLETALDGVATKAENAEKLAKTADKALGSTVLGQPAGDRARESVKKSAEVFSHFDTAYGKLPD